MYLLALVSLAATVTGCGSASGFSTALPQPVQRAIAKNDPGLAYVPTRLPPGYHYTEHFSYGPNDFGLSFNKSQRPARPARLPRSGRPTVRGGAMHSSV